MADLTDRLASCSQCTDTVACGKTEDLPQSNLASWVKLFFNMASVGDRLWNAVRETNGWCHRDNICILNTLCGGQKAGADGFINISHVQKTSYHHSQVSYRVM